MYLFPFTRCRHLLNSNFSFLKFLPLRYPVLFYLDSFVSFIFHTSLRRHPGPFTYVKIYFILEVVGGVLVVCVCVGVGICVCECVCVSGSLVLWTCVDDVGPIV